MDSRWSSSSPQSSSRSDLLHLQTETQHSPTATRQEASGPPPNYLLQHPAPLLPATQHRGQEKTKPPSLFLLTSKEIFILPLKQSKHLCRGIQRPCVGSGKTVPRAKGACIAKGDRGDPSSGPFQHHAAAACGGHKLHKCTAPFTAAAPRRQGGESQHARKHSDQVMEGVGDS